MKYFLIFSLICLTTLVVKSQNSQTAEDNYKKQREDEWIRKNKQSGQPAPTNLPQNTNNNNHPNLPSEKPSSPSEPKRNIDKVDSKEREKLKNEVQEILNQINEKFTIPDQYVAKHSIFLSQKDTGIARIFPDKNCDVGIVVTVEMLEKCANLPQIKGSGSRYSIRFNWIPSNIHPFWLSRIFENTDMHFINDSLFVGNQRTLGIISEIGNIDLNQQNLKSGAVKFLLKFKAATTFKKFKEQKDIFNNGISENGYNYATSAIVKTNSTYIFRSIAYPLSEDYSETDLLFILQTVGKEEDGSLVFLWKKLKEKKSPFIKFK